MGFREPLKLLVVEDAPRQTRRLVDALSHAGLDPQPAAMRDAGQALDAIESRPWDLLVVGRAGARHIVRELHGLEERASEAITESQRLDERARFLARTGAELASIATLAEVLPAAARAPVPALADGCVIQLAGPGGRTVAAHRDPEREPELLARWVGDAAPADEVMATGDPRWSTDHLCVPLQARGRCLGALTLVVDGDDRCYDARDLITGEDLAGRVALALDNARLCEATQQSLRARDEFLGLVAHELKTPMTPLLLQVHGLRRALDRLPEEAAATARLRLESIERAAVRLDQLLDRLLDISSMCLEPMLLERAPTRMTEVVDAVVERMRGELDRAGVRLTVQVDADIAGDWDRARLQQAVGNLLTNAIKYGERGPIEITIGGGGQVGWVSIRDHGRGIAADELTDLFRRFERRAPVDHFGGLGLGLWVVQRIAMAHGGRVDLWSHPGQGARFALVLPRSNDGTIDQANPGDRG